jgi:molybdopterin converting factor small subunit
MGKVQNMSQGPNSQMVDVHLFAAARAAVGSSFVQVAPGTLATICAELDARYPEVTAVRPRCSFLLDEVAMHGDPASIEIPAGSRLDVLPPFAGG